MDICFLGQSPFSNESAEKIILKSLKNEVFNQFTAIVAFATEGGVKSIVEQIKNAKKHHAEVEFYIGIDQQVTSYEALNLLLKSQIDCYIYHSNSDFIFHPKIYIFEGKECGKIIIGSSNLTTKGLSLNMEASLEVDFKMNDEQEIDLLHQIKNHYRFLSDKTLPNIEKLTPKLLDLFVDLKKVPKGKKAKSEKNKPPQDKKLLDKFNAMFPPVKIPRGVPKSTKRKTPKTDVKKVRKVIQWQDTNPHQADDYRHPDIGSTHEALQTKLTDKEGKVVKKGDLIEWIGSKKPYKDKKAYGRINKITHNLGGKTYKDGHPRYHVIVKDATVQYKDGNTINVKKMQVKIERVKKVV